MKLSLATAVILAAISLAFPAWAEEGDAPDEKPKASEKPETPTSDAPAPEDKDTDKVAEAQESPAAKVEAGEAGAAETETPAVKATVESTPEAPDAEAAPKAEAVKEAETTASVKVAPEETESKTVVPPEQQTLGLAPGAPEIATLPGGVTPAFGSQTAQSKESKFEFHGLVYLPLRFGINKREDPGSGQKETVLHAPPRVPGDFETFGYTSTVPHPWSQLNFSYGNQTVMATVIVAARTVTNANGYFDPPDMLGINDAYLTFRVPTPKKLKLQFNLGAFANRYGNMGEYDLGRYGTPLIGRVSGTGLTGTGMLLLGDVTLMTEVGFQGQLNKAPVGVEPAGWNGFADPNVGSSFAGHAHLGVNVRKLVNIGGHFINTFTRDDRATSATQPDGDITVLGFDTRFTVGRFGHLYLGYANTDADSARSVSNVLRVLNAPGGPGLMREYLGPDSGGTGTLNTFGGQLDLSLGNLLRYPEPFEGNGPDLMLSGFLVYTGVKSPNDSDYDGVNKLKLGGELGYSVVRWLALGFRYDHVLNDVDDAKQSQGIVTGRIILHSDWNSQDQVVLQYSNYRNGSRTAVREGYPPEDDPSIDPDAHVLSVTASMWW